MKSLKEISWKKLNEDANCIIYTKKNIFMLKKMEFLSSIEQNRSKSTWAVKQFEQ